MPIPRDGLTRPQLVLLAARRLTADGLTPFRLADLAAACWQDRPDLFSLATTLVRAPDVKVLSWTVQGRNGLVRTGRLAKVGKETYALTEAGAAVAEQAAADRRRRPMRRGRRPRRGALSARVERLVAAALDSAAYRKWQMGLAADVTWAEAGAFWGKGGPARLAADLAAAYDRVPEAGAELAGGRLVTRADLTALGLAGARLAERFSRQLERACRH
jgi:hypothetical protein